MFTSYRVLKLWGSKLNFFSRGNSPHRGLWERGGTIRVDFNGIDFCNQMLEIWKNHCYRTSSYRQHKLTTKFGAFLGFRLIPYASPLCPPSRQMDLRLSVYPSLTVTLSERFELTKFYHFSSWQVETNWLKPTHNQTRTFRSLVNRWSYFGLM